MTRYFTVTDLRQDEHARLDIQVVHVVCCDAGVSFWHIALDRPAHQGLEFVSGFRGLRTWADDRHRWSLTRMPSRPGEFHPEPLTDPDLTLSRHPARAIARRLPPSTEPSGSSRYDPVGPSSTAMTHPLRSTGITPLQHYYGAVRPSPAHRYVRPRGWSRLCLFPWHRRPGSHVPYKSQIELRAASMPDAAWAVSGHPPN